MSVSNRELRQAARQVFASSRAIVTPFFNRIESRQELAEIFDRREDLRGTAIVVSSPLGTGKTFFIDQIGSELGIVGRERPFFVRTVTEVALKRDPGAVAFVDEGDIKAPWSGLERGIQAVGDFLASSGRIGLVLGDFVLRNPDLLEHLPRYRFLQHFEPLDRPFLEGVVRQRVNGYLQSPHGDRIIQPELYEVLVPESMARVNSFRSTLSFLEALTRILPYNSDQCCLTLEMAVRFAAEEFDPFLSTERQERFLNLFLDHLKEHHPRASGMENGFDRETMFSFGTSAGYHSWEEFEDEIIEPFGDQGLLLSRGIPGLNDRGDFIRWVEPFYPSLQLMLLAQA